LLPFTLDFLDAFRSFEFFQRFFTVPVEWNTAAAHVFVPLSGFKPFGVLLLQTNPFYFLLKKAEIASRSSPAPFSESWHSYTAFFKDANNVSQHQPIISKRIYRGYICLVTYIALPLLISAKPYVVKHQIVTDKILEGL